MAAACQAVRITIVRPRPVAASGATTRFQKLQRQWIEGSLTPAIERLVESIHRIGPSDGEQCHRGLELHVIGRAEYLIQRSGFEFQNRAGAELEPRSQNRMGEIGTSFVQRRDAIEGRYRGVPEAAQLREHEPHPVTPFPACLQLSQSRRNNRRLGGNEALQVERISGAHHASVESWTLRLGLPIAAPAGSTQVRRKLTWTRRSAA